MEQVGNPSVGTRSQGSRWLVESFASRAALLGFIYLCVNVIYQLGYLSKLGIEFGLFSITRTFPVFENFLIAAYSFFIWGFVVETSASTYDHFFGFFKPTSWRDRKIRQYRSLTLGLLLVFYLTVHVLYLQIHSFHGENFLFWNTNLNYFRVLLLLLSPSWEFLSWRFTFFAVFSLVGVFFIFNRQYRHIRSSALRQTLAYEKSFMQFHINVISPAAMLLSGLLLLIIIPSAVGRLSADLTINDFRFGQNQEIESIELTNVSSFCGEEVVNNGPSLVWHRHDTDDFSIHFLGNFGDFDVFVKINDQNKNNNSYNVCFIEAGSIQTILFPQDISY